MKKKLLSVAALVLSLSFTAISQDISLLDGDNGFLGIRFGQDVDSVKRIITQVPISGDETKHEELYRVTKKQYYGFATAKLKDFTLNFWEGKIDNMYIEVDAENGPIMLQELESVYGKPTKPSPRNPIYVWQGKKVYMQMIMKANGAADINITSLVMKKKREEAFRKKKEAEMSGSY